MAERRMFAKSIVQGSRFLKMPVSSRELYFQMGMAADDDGVVEAWNIMRLTNAREDDLKVLVAKGFVQILDDEDLIAYLTDWEANNSIRKDRYHAGIYRDLKVQIVTMQPSVNQLTTICQPNDNQTTTEDRIGKDRIGKVIENTTYSLSTSVDPQPKVTDVVNLYHEICKSYPKVRSISNNRRKAINARLRTHSMEEVREVFEKAERSTFLKGGNKRNWSASFDWLMTDDNFCKVLDGNYDDKDSYQAREAERHEDTRSIPTEEEFDAMFGKRVDDV